MEPSIEVAKAGFSKSLADCDPRLQAAFPLVRAEWRARHPTLDLRCDYTYRSPALQFELFKKGRAQDEHGNWVLVDRNARVTDKDGTFNRGEHNYYPSKAADVYVCEADTSRGSILWPLDKNHPDFHERNSLYLELGHLWEQHGLVSGATWKYAWKDAPHIQTPA